MNARFLILSLILMSFGLVSAQATSLPADYWQQLLEETQEASIERQLSEEGRLQLQQTQHDTQASARAEAQAEQQRLTAERERLEAEQLQLEADLDELQALLQRRSASLGEVFALYEDEKSQAYALISEALVTQQNPQLLDSLRPSARRGLPSINDFYALWDSLQAAWIASAQVEQYTSSWVNAEGRQQQATLTRLGDIQLLNEQGLLRYEHGQPATLWSRQPASVQRQAAAFHQQSSDRVTFDPARGLTLRLFSHQPGVLERIQQGGLVGYLILLLGALGLLIALLQLLRLGAEHHRVKAQLKQLDQPLNNNVLGRVLGRLAESAPSLHAPAEALEARLDELLLRESAALERGLSWIKLLAAIAPLLGLLGTVTGMIATFQAITLFGTGDPSMMASGISQALVTTVLGLLMAVPLLLAHLLLQGRSRQLARTLEAESSAWLAQRLKPMDETC